MYLKKLGKIQSNWMTNCKIKLKGSPQEAKLLVIKNMFDLKKYTKLNKVTTIHSLITHGRERKSYFLLICGMKPKYMNQ